MAEDRTGPNEIVAKIGRWKRVGPVLLFLFARVRIDRANATVETGLPDDANPTATRKFIDESTDLKSLRDAVLDAASLSNGLWISYVFLLFYLFVAAGMRDAS